MKSVDHIVPTLPSHLVRRPESKNERRETGQSSRRKRKPRMPTGHKSGEDGKSKHIDELA